jgi:hypothetical protein
MIGNVCNDPLNTENIVNGKVTPVLNYVIMHYAMLACGGVEVQIHYY